MTPDIPWACVLTTWTPKIGDPTVMGWVTVAGYLLAAILATLVSSKQTARQRIFWLVLAVILFALTVNKQLDLQSALTAMGRCIAKAQGWYADRRPFQIKFIMLIAATSVLIAITLTWAMRRELHDIWLALLGLVFLLAFVAIRAAGFHHFDRLIGYQINNIRMNWVMELGGIAMIAANALYLLLRTPKKTAAPH